MRFRILGPLELWDNGKRLPVGGPQQRALLAVLLLNANPVVSADRLVEYLWGGQPPPTARSLLQGCVAQLRRALRTSDNETIRQLIATRPPGYVMEVRPGELDLYRFEELVAAARQSLVQRSTAAQERSAALLHEALSLWRGPALDDIALDACHTEAARLEEHRLAVLEERIDVDLQLGRRASLVGELQTHVREHPLRERLWAQLMLALCGADRQADALAAYRQLRQTLVEQLGVDPGTTAQRLEHAILSGTDAFEIYRQERGIPRAEGEPEPRESDHAVPAQLPAATAAFTGRTQHLKQLDELLADEADGGAIAVPIAVVTGTAGIGKTALAVHWAHQARDRFADGQLYVNLRGYAPNPPVRPIEALAGFLHALGVPAEQTPVDLEQAAALYRTLLTGKRMLVVLDNAYSAEQVRPLLPGSPGCVVLVTSRDRLGGLVARDGAHLLTLDVLGPDEAHALLARVLGPDRVHAEPDAAAQLARMCARLPLALRIAAANLACDPGRNIADHAAELREGNRLGTLQVDGDEQTAVRAAFDLSYATLAPDSRRMFRLLGLVPGADVTPEAAAALARVAPRHAASLLDRLADAHLLDRHDGGRFGFHDLLWLYAAERAGDEDAPAKRHVATQRLFDWYLDTVDTAACALYPTALRLQARPVETRPSTTAGFDEPAGALAWLDAERRNLLATVQYAADHGPHPVAWLLADALRGYFMLRIYPVEWLAVAHAGLAAAEADGDLNAQSAGELSLADAWLRQTRFDLAIGHYERALALTRQTGWLKGQSAALGNLGNAYWWSGRPQEAVGHYTQALAIDRRTGWLAGQAVKLGNLGNVYRDLGQLELAADYLAAALALFRQLGSRSGEALGLVAVGETCHALGRFTEAVDFLGRAVTMHREVGDRGNEANSLRVLGAVHRDAGRHRQALELAQVALAHARETGERRFEADALNTLGTIHERHGDHERAVDHHEQALQLARETGTRYPELEALIGLAAAHARDCPDQARILAQQAVSLAGQAGYRLLEGQACTALAGLHAASGLPDQAIELAQRALTIHRDTGHRLGEARTLLILGHALRHTNEPSSATCHWEQARALLIDIGVPEADHVASLLGQA